MSGFPERLRWVLVSAGLLGTVACDREESTEATGEAGPGVSGSRTTDWPVDRGGGELSGRVDDPAPENPAVEWTFEADSGLIAPPVVAGGVIYVGSVAGTFYAIDAVSGGLVWKKEGEDAIEGAACVAGELVLIGSNAKVLKALDRASGEVVWKLGAGDKFSSGASLLPGVDGGGPRVLVNGYEGMTYCLSPEDGSVVWSVRWEDHINGTPALLPGGQWLAFGGCDHGIHTLRLEDGEVVSSLSTEAYITNTAATFEGMIYAGNYAGQVVAVAAGGDTPEWVYKAGKLPFFSSPAIGDEAVFIGSRDKHLHAIDRSTGECRWKFRTGGRIDSSPLRFRDAVVFGSWDGRLYSLDPADGGVRWSLDLGEPLSGSPAFAGGRIIVGGNRGSLFSIRDLPAKQP